MGLVVGEGIETTLTARQLGFRPAWALGSVGAIAAFSVLSGIEALTILAEAGKPSADAVQICGQRWSEAGREVIVVSPRMGADINDALRGAA
jgi:putative DNA primase/helicase